MNRAYGATRCTISVTMCVCVCVCVCVLQCVCYSVCVCVIQCYRVSIGCYAETQLDEPSLWGNQV
jgi:hypothetical protein